VGADRAAAPAGAAEAQGRTAPGVGPGGADGDPVRAEDGHPLGVLACRDGVWERDDVLAQAARLVPSGRLARLHQVLLEELAQADRIDWDRAALDSAALPAPGGQETGKNPTDRGKQGTKRHLVVDAHGIPLAVLVSAANVHDSKMMLATVDAIEPIRAKTRGRPRRRPHKLHADKGYDYRHLRLALRKRRIIPRIARCGVEPKNRLGRYRWVVERTLSWLNRFRRLKIRYEHRADIHLAFLQLGCALISLRFLG
jgi:transposase